MPPLPVLTKPSLKRKLHKHWRKLRQRKAVLQPTQLLAVNRRYLTKLLQMP
jgi:hypothetical protein